MKRTILFSIFAVLLGILALELIKRDTGYILISIGPWAVETSFWLGLFLVVITVSVFILLKRLIKGGLKGVVNSLTWFSGNRDRAALRRTNAGLIHFIEGNWAAAKTELLSAAKKVDEPLLHYLAAAQSAHQMNMPNETQFLIEQARLVGDEHQLAVAISLARMQLIDGKYESALETLKPYAHEVKRHPVVLDLLKQIYRQLHMWPALIELLPLLKNSKLVQTSEYETLEEHTYLSHMKLQVDKAAAENKLEKLDAIWQQIPRHLKKNSRIIGAYAAQLHNLKQEDKAEAIVRKALQRQWHQGLVGLYGNIRSSHPKQQLATAEVWLTRYQDDADLFYALGKLSLANELWGKAKDYFEKSLKLRARPEVYVQLANLFAQLGEHQKSSQLYQKGLLLTAE